MSKKKKIALIVCAAILVLVALIVVPCLLRARANDKLAKELHAEFDAWLETVPQIPDEENGALVILPLLEKLEDYPTRDEHYHSSTRNGSQVKIEGSGRYFLENAQHRKILRSYVSRNEDTLREIGEALKREKYRYSIDYGRHYIVAVPHLFRLQNAVEAFRLKGDLARLDGKSGEAFEQDMKALRCALTLSNDRILISYFTQVSICEKALASIAAFISEEDLSKDRLADLLSALKNWRMRRTAFAASLDFEFYCFAKSIAQGIEENRSLQEIAECITQDGYSEKRDRGVFSILLSKHAYYFRPDIEFMCKYVRDRQALDPAHYYKLRGKLAEMDETAKNFKAEIFESTELGFARMALPFIGLSTHARAAVGETFWRGVIITTAVKLFQARNKRLPVNIDELGGLVAKEMLVDPFSGMPFVYRLKGERDFSLYSVGIDGVDSRCEDTRFLFRSKPGEIHERVEFGEEGKVTIYREEPDEGEPDDIVFHAPDREKEE